MISDRIEEPSVETPWDNNKVYIMNYQYTGIPHVPYGNTILDDVKENKIYWIIVNWESEWLDQHKDYRTYGDYAKLLDDLYLYRGVAFSVKFKEENDIWKHELIDTPKAYEYEMWDGDQRYMETISIKPLECSQEDIEDTVRKFEQNLLNYQIAQLTAD